MEEEGLQTQSVSRGQSIALCSTWLDHERGISCFNTLLTWGALCNLLQGFGQLGGLLGGRADDILENAVCCADLDGLAMPTFAKYGVADIGLEAKLPEHNACTFTCIRPGDLFCLRKNLGPPLTAFSSMVGLICIYTNEEKRTRNGS